MVAAAPAQAATTVSQTFTSTTPETFTVPSYVNEITIEAVGGRGGGNRTEVSGYVSAGTRAALTRGTLSVTPGQQFSIHVGGNGGEGSQYGPPPEAGANGGQPGNYMYFGGSGGASDVRSGGTALSNRVLVAGGGGGGGSGAQDGSGPWGHAGQAGAPYGPFYGCTLVPAQPGSQSAGGAAGTSTGCSGGVVIPHGTAGSLGVGGIGGASFQVPGGSPWSASPPGGGGYYGGGGGTFSGGAGGSSYFSAAFRSTTNTLAPADSTPYVKISWLSEVREISFTSVPNPIIGTTAEVGFTLRGANGPLVGMNPAVSVSSGTVSQVTDLGGGAYRALIAASSTAGAATVTVVAGGDTGTATMTYRKRLQSINAITTPTDPRIGDSWTVTPTSTSGRAVSWSAAGSCEPGSATSVRFTAVGPCAVTFTLPEDAEWEGDMIVHGLQVGRIKQAIQFTAPTGVRVGVPVELSATGGASGRPITYSTADAEICTVAGSQLTVHQARTCTVTAHQAGDDRHDPAAQRSVILTALPGAQTITFVPVDTADVGDSVTLSAQGGPSGNPVTFAVDETSTVGSCALSSGNLAFTGEGTCRITASQAGNRDYEPATPVTADIVVSRIATSLQIDALPAITHGQDAKIEVSVPGGIPGSVRFTVDGVAGSWDRTVSNGIAAITMPGLEAGNYTVTARFTPSDLVTYRPSPDQTAQLRVAQAGTRAGVTVFPDRVVAAVASTESGTGQPTGWVDFMVDGDVVGTAPVFAGVATLTHTVSASAARTVSVLYRGDRNFSASAGSTVRSNPTLVARLSSRANAKGWHNRAVTISFTCAPGSGSLASACPAPITVSSAKARTVTRTIHAADGGIATVSVRGLNVDTVKPRVRVRGVTSGKRYTEAPKVRCVAADSGSGIRSCKVSRQVRGTHIRYVATARDQAGHTTTAVVRARLQPVKLQLRGASMRGGVAQVRSGAQHSVTLVVTSKYRPTYLAAERSPRTPKQLGQKLYKVGKNTWAIGVTFESQMRPNTNWRIGVRVKGKTYTIPLRVIG